MPDAFGLLDYVAEHLPAARARRSGLLRQGPVRDIRLRVDHEEFRGRVRGDGALELLPALEPAQWAERLLAALRRRAASDAEVRSALSRAGWALS